MNDKITIEQLMQQALAGDSNAYNSALGQIIHILKPYLLKRLNDKSEVDDVLQEILISVHKARHTYDGNRPFKPWLYAIAKYRLQDHLRRYYTDKLRHAVDISEIDNTVITQENEQEMTYQSIQDEIALLPGKQSAIVQLIHADGYTSKEVAAKLNMQQSAVKVAAYRAYKTLKKKLG